MPEMSPNLELPIEERTKEGVLALAKYYKELITTYIATVEQGTEDRPARKLLAAQLKDLTGKLTPEYLSKGKFELMIRKAQDNKEDTGKLKREEDMGVWAQIKIGDGIEVNINLKDARRVITQADLHDSPKAAETGKSFTARSDDAMSKPGKVNINIEINGLIEHDIWISMTPPVTSPERQSIAVTTYTSASLYLERNEMQNVFPVTIRYPKATAAIAGAREVDEALYTLRDAQLKKLGLI